MAGRVDGVVGPYASELAFTYNGPVLTAEEWIGDTVGTVSWALGGDGRITSQSVNGSSTINFTFDDDELLTAAGAVTLDRSTLTGWIETVTVGDIEETLGYDDFGAVESSEVVYDGTTSLFEYTLVRDELGRITEQTESVEGNTPVVWSYQYDERGRLSRVDRGMLYVEYEYDANGNRLSVAVMGGMPTEATYDEQDRIESYGSIEFEHGAAGEIIEKRYDEFDAREYEFDALGNLLRVTLPDSTEISYDYDARGRLIARYVDEAFDKGWLWQDQLNPVAEVDEEGEVTARYVYGSRGHVPDYVVTGGETYRIITDYRGSVRMVVDDEGDVVETIEYGPWGEIFAQSGTALQSFGFAGGMWDRDTDLVRFGARWYDPEIGRWIMKDPIGFGGGQANLYVYVENEPITWIDPWGIARKYPWNLWELQHWNLFWGLPNQVVGAWQLAAAVATGGHVTSVEDVWVVQGGWLNVHNRFNEGYGAWTIGKFVIAGDNCPMNEKSSYDHVPASPMRMDHEEGHEDQSLLMGPFYLPFVWLVYGYSHVDYAFTEPEVRDVRGALYPTNLLDRWANEWAGGH